MISVIICHRSTFFLKTILENIKQTVGCTFEIIEIDNRENDYSIFQAYNRGVNKAKFPLLCFCHEDILFHTPNWGEKLQAHFEDPSIGMLGVIGGNVFPKSPSPWWASSKLNDHLVNNIQHWTQGVSKQPYHTLISETKEESITRDYHNPSGNNVVEAAVVDGLFFVIRKDLFDKGLVKFDEENFKGFHCYDSDISLQVGQYKKVVVVYDILVEHFQQGSINKGWYDSVLVLAKKWNSKLPVIKKDIDKQLLPEFEAEVLQTFIYWMMGSGYYSKKEISQVINYFLPFIEINKFNLKVLKQLKSIQWFGPRFGRLGRLLPQILLIRK